MNFELLKEKASLKGITEIETYSVKNHGINLSLYEGNVESNNTEMSDVVCVRGVYNNHIATVYTENATDESIDFIVDSIIKNATLITKNDPYVIYGGDSSYKDLPKTEVDFDVKTLADKIDLCKRAYEYIKTKPYFYKAEVEYMEEQQELSIVNTNGLNVSQKDKDALFVVEYIAFKDGDVKVAYDFLPVKKFSDIKLEEFCDNIVEKAVSQFGAEPCVSGSYNVVFDKDCMRSLLGAFSGLFTADTVLKKLSLLGDKLGQKVFNDKVTLIDDPIHPLAQNKRVFDDEGVSTKETVVCENGVLKSFLHNLSTAQMLNSEPTGNGFKGSVSSAVAVVPSNLYIKPGEKSLEELFELAGEGIYITNLQGLHAGVNFVSGDYSLQCGGYMIHNGKRAEAVTLIIVSSNIIATLNNVVEIGNDLSFRSKIGSPSVLISGMAISGK